MMVLSRFGVQVCCIHTSRCAHSGNITCPRTISLLPAYGKYRMLITQLILAETQQKSLHTKTCPRKAILQTLLGYGLCGPVHGSALVCLRAKGLTGHNGATKADDGGV